MEEVTCVKCGQKGDRCEDPSGIFSKGLVFGRQDQWAFHWTNAGQICGSCRMRTMPGWKLAEYGIERKRALDGSFYYKKLDRPRPAASYQEVPPMFKRVALSGFSRFIQQEVTRWFDGEKPQLTILGAAEELEWAIFRLAVDKQVAAQHWSTEQLVSHIRQELTSESCSRTMNGMKRYSGILILHDIFGIHMTPSRQEWLNAILDERHAQAHKTVVSMLQREQDYSSPIWAKLKRYGIAIGVDGWGREFLGQEEVA